MNIELTIYFVGANEEEALAGLPFDSIESAEDYAVDQGTPYPGIYSATAVVQIDTIKQV